MKGFPDKCDGPLGPWMKLVREHVNQLVEGDTKARVLDLLGEPDVIRDGSNSPVKQLQEMMEDVAGGPTLIQYGSTESFDEILVYHDPCRPTCRYVFAISRGHISESWQERG
ncbi:MAG: hypothetical protein K8T91_26020 [Planctomycetes bacterium]|nr:hypothetical protein [Planctomycetota bacterium]